MTTTSARQEIYEAIYNLKELTHSMGLNLYWVAKDHEVITHKQSHVNVFKNCMLSIDDETYIPTLAASYKQIIFVRDVTKLLEINPTIKVNCKESSIICVPIMNFGREVLVVLELYKTDGDTFSEKTFNYIHEFSIWFGIWLSRRYKYDEEANSADYRNKLIVYLLEYVSKPDYERFLYKFFNCLKEYLKASKCFFYDYDSYTRFTDFYEEINNVPTKTVTRLKFYKIGSYCYQVRESRLPLQINFEADCDYELLDKEIKQDPKNPLRHMIFYPLVYADQYLGILIIADYENCPIVDEDNPHVAGMISLFADALIYRYIMQNMDRLAARTELLKETLINFLRSRLRPQSLISGNIVEPKKLHRFNWELADVNDPNLMSYLYKIFQKVYHFDWDRLKSFLQCVQIAYNDYPYHNIRTTFYLTRIVYCVIDKLNLKLKPFEKASLLIAAVIYYCGHNGLDNRCMWKTNHYLNKIYKMYMKENHKIWMLKLLLDQTHLISGIDDSAKIISTTNSLLLQSRKYASPGFRKKIALMLDSDTLNLANDTHRKYALLLITRVGILGRHMQSYNVAKMLREQYYEELLRLGDFEKEKGLQSAEIKNRDMSYKKFHYETEFIQEHVLPTLELLTRIFPETGLAMNMPKDILKANAILLDIGERTLWDPDSSVVKTRSST